MSDEFHWSASRGKRWQAAAIAALATPLIRLMSWTWRFQVTGREHLDAVEREGRPPILAFWHGRILPGMVFFRDRGIVVITSENFDGEWIARIIRRFGFGTARGSSSRGGVKALVRLKRALADGRAAAFTVDGPRGPRHVAQPGAVWLARASGSPILAFHVEADRCWTLRSWDRSQIPQPFARLRLCIDPPMYVPPERSIDEALAELQARLERLASDLGAPPNGGCRPHGAGPT